MNNWRKNRLGVLLLCAACLAVAAASCGGRSLPCKVVHGSVTCGGQQVDNGRVRFVPIEDTPGPVSTGVIENGQYRITSRDGVPVGKHRVEIVILKKTGRKVPSPNDAEEMIDEEVSVGASEYAGSGSPLAVEVSADSDGQMDFDVPASHGAGR